MNPLQTRLHELNPSLLDKLNETEGEVKLLLDRFIINFPTYTDHSINHTKEVFRIASELLTPEEINNLTADEIYILSMASLLHDIGMCIPIQEINEICKEDKYKELLESPTGLENEIFIRDIHHILSYEFIKRESSLLKISDANYAEAIALVAKGHRKVALDDNKEYKPKFFIKSGREFVCLPYLASILRLADELDITNIRTPKLLTKHYMPNNEQSIREWEKNISTTQINFTEDKVMFSVKCSDQNNLAALEEQFDKIQNVINYCQKTVRTISNTEARRFKLNLIKCEPKYEYLGFDPKGIKFSFNVQNVVNTFIGEDLYEEELTSIREALQNSIDSCRYKHSIFGDEYTPNIVVTICDSNISISNNGLGMDEFVIENFFGRLGSSFYEQEKIKKEFEAIGQFGVGVFSYFLMSEYIDIETKTDNGNSIKFRIDKDPKNYFHFYNHSCRCETGTTITLFLKKELVGRYSFKDYENYISNSFRYIEFPIKIFGFGNETEKVCDSMDIDFEMELKNRLNIEYRKEFNRYQSIKYSINNDEYEGACELIILRFNSKFYLKDISKYFDREMFRTEDFSSEYSQISISQKGVFVNNYSCDYLKFVIGNINIKRSKKININRNEFSDFAGITSIIEQFEIGLIKNLFEQLKRRYKKDIVNLTDDFLIHYFSSSYYPEPVNYSKFKDAFDDNLFVDFFDGEKVSIISFKELNEKVDKFLLISSFENQEEIYNTFKIPIVNSKSYGFQSSYIVKKRIFINIYNFTPSIVTSDNKAYQIFNKQGYKEYETDLKIFKLFI